MRRAGQRLLRIGIVAVAFNLVIAEEEGDPFAEPRPGSTAPQLPPEPVHLVPLDPYPGDWRVPYTEQLRRKLKFAPRYCSANWGYIEYCKAPADEREKRLNAVEQKADALEKYLDVYHP